MAIRTTEPGLSQSFIDEMRRFGVKIEEVPVSKARHDFDHALFRGDVRKAKRIAKRHGIDLREQLNGVRAALEGPLKYITP
jgi:hypothetical protein